MIKDGIKRSEGGKKRQRQTSMTSLANKGGCNVLTIVLTCKLQLAKFLSNVSIG